METSGIKWDCTVWQGDARHTSHSAHRQPPYQALWQALARTDLGLLTLGSSNEESPNSITTRWQGSPRTESPNPVFSALPWAIRLGQQCLSWWWDKRDTLFLNLSLICVKATHVQSLKSPTIPQGSILKNNSLPAHVMHSWFPLPEGNYFPFFQLFLLHIYK